MNKKLWASKNGQKYTNQLPLIFDSDFFDNYNFQIGTKNRGIEYLLSNIK